MEITNPMRPSSDDSISTESVPLFRLLRLIGRFSRRKDRLVSQPFEELSGLSLKTFHALHLIARDCQQPGELVRQLGIPHSTATRILDTLAAEGLIERKPNPKDQRQQQLKLTRSGHIRYEIALAHYLDCLHRSFGQLPPQAIEDAIAALERLDQLMAALPEAGSGA